MAKSYENTLFVITGALDLPERTLRPYLDKINDAVGSLGISTEVLAIPGMIQRRSSCKYADPEGWGHRGLDILGDHVSNSRGAVIVNPDEDNHGRGILRYAVNGIGSTVASNAPEGRLFVTHQRPIIRGPEPNDELWDSRIRDLAKAVALNGNYDKLTAALR